MASRGRTASGGDGADVKGAGSKRAAPDHQAAAPRRNAPSASVGGERRTRKRGRGADTAQTKSMLMDAAFETVREDGFAGVTARAVADRAHTNQAAIYYHFGGIEPLLLAALERSGEQRLATYRQAFSEPLTLSGLIGELEVLYRRDRASGHLRVLAQLVAGAVTSPELAEGIRAATAPWIEFVENQVTAALERLPFSNLFSATDLTELIFSLVIGIETRGQVDDNPELSDRLFEIAKIAARIVESGAV